MPTYELRCDDCGAAWDLFLLRLLKDADKICPECGSSHVRPGVGGGILGSGARQSAAPASCGGGSFG